MRDHYQIKKLFCLQREKYFFWSRPVGAGVRAQRAAVRLIFCATGAPGERVGGGGGRRGGEGGGRRCVCPGPLQVVRRPGRFQTYPHSKRGGLFFMVGVVRIFDPLRSKTCHNYKPLRLRAASLLALVGGVVVCLVVNPPPGTLRWGRETVYAKVRKPRTETFLKETKYMMNATNSSVFGKCWR